MQDKSSSLRENPSLQKNLLTWIIQSLSSKLGARALEITLQLGRSWRSGIVLRKPKFLTTGRKLSLGHSVNFKYGEQSGSWQLNTELHKRSKTANITGNLYWCTWWVLLAKFLWLGGKLHYNTENCLQARPKSQVPSRILTCVKVNWVPVQMLVLVP